MSIYDTLLANQQQGLQTQNANQMQIAQMPTFADKFLAGLRSGQQMGMQNQMHLSQMNHLQAMNDNYAMQRENQVRGQDIKDRLGTLATAQRQAASERLADLKKQRIDVQNKLDQAVIDGKPDQIALWRAQASKLATDEQQTFNHMTQLYGTVDGEPSEFEQNQAANRFAKYNPPSVNPGTAPVINATTKLNETARKNATTDLNKGWMFASPEQRMKLLTNNGSDPGEAKILATQPMAPLGNAAVQKVLQQGIEQHRQILQASPTATTETVE